MSVQLKATRRTDGRTVFGAYLSAAVPDVGHEVAVLIEELLLRARRHQPSTEPLLYERG